MKVFDSLERGSTKGKKHFFKNENCGILQFFPVFLSVPLCDLLKVLLAFILHVMVKKKISYEILIYSS